MTRRLALWAGLLAMMAAGSAAPGLRMMETEEVDAAEWAALEQAMAMAGATGNTTATAPRVTHAGNSTGAGGAVANASAAAGVGDLEDLEDCVIGEGSRAAPMASAHAPMASAHAIALAVGLPGGSVDSGARARVSHTKAAAGCLCAHVGSPSADNALCAAYHSSAPRVLGPSSVVCYSCLHGVRCQGSSTEIKRDDVVYWYLIQ